MSNFDCCAVSSLEKVFSDRAPRLKESGNICFSNEVFSFQIAYKSESIDYTLSRMTWEVKGDLVEFLQVRPVYSVPCSMPCQTNSDDFYLTKQAMLIPDLLAEEDFFGIRPGQWNALWITVRGNLPSGMHTIRIDLKNGDEVLGSVTYTLEVLSQKLPQSRLKYAHWMYYDCIAQQSGTQWGTKEFEQVVQKYLKNACEHGVNVCFVPLFTPPINTAVGLERETTQLVEIHECDGVRTYGFEKLLAFMKTASECGMRYFEMAHLFTQWGAEHAPQIVAERDGTTRRIFGWKDDSLGEGYLSFLQDLLPKLTDVLRKNDYTAEQVFFHISDEPKQSQLERYCKLKQTVQHCIGEYKTMDALSDYGFYANNAVDFPVVASEHAQEFFAHGVENMWIYYCCGEGFDNLSNRFLSMPLQRTRIIGWQLYLMNSKGFLHWGYNFYNSALSERAINPYLVTDADGSFPSGDSFIVYPSGKGKPLDSMRHETMFDAIQDYRTACLLEEYIGREQVCAFLNGEGVCSMTDYPHEAEKLGAIRRKMIAKIREEECRRHNAVL